MSQPTSTSSSCCSFLVDHRPFQKETTAGKITAIAKRVLMSLIIIGLLATAFYYASYGIFKIWNPANLPESTLKLIASGAAICGCLGALRGCAKSINNARKRNEKTAG